MPSLIVPHERFNLYEFQCSIVYSCLFLQDPPGSLLWMLQSMKIIVGQKPSILTVGAHSVFHQQSRTVMQGCNMGYQGMRVALGSVGSSLVRWTRLALIDSEDYRRRRIPLHCF